MSRHELSELEAALLCRLYYLEPASSDRLRSPFRKGADLHSVMAGRLSSANPADADGGLQRLLAHQLVTHDRRGWKLTDRGRTLAYEAGELEIQRLSGLWGVVARIIPGRPSFQRVLDVGSAGGSAATAMREAGILAADGTYIGVDISHRALTAGVELTRRGGREDAVTLRIQGTAYRLPLAGKAVDCCVSRSTLYYLQKRPVLMEMARVAKEGGYLVVAVPTIGYMGKRALRGLATLRFREALKYAAATIFGVVAWLGVDVRPPHALFSGETKRGLRAQIARVPGVRLVFLERLPLPFLGSPLLLVAKKLTG
jgi:SAM-dependent methyltransferase